MIDIDHFKSINDDHGHATGDEVLQAVGKTLLNESRQSDIVCRYGGEEFSVLMRDTDLESAMAIAERFRQAIKSLEFENLSITVSVGVSSFSLGATDAHELIDQADQCLYAAKRNGRDQVVRFDHIESLGSSDDSVECPEGEQRDSKVLHEIDATDDEDTLLDLVQSVLNETNEISRKGTQMDLLCQKLMEMTSDAK